MVFFANAALLVLQLMAGRLLAPFVGSSLATWTAVIGVFLAGISMGNWLGGKLADRAASGKALRLLLVAGGLLVTATVVEIQLLGDGQIVRFIPLYPRIALLTLGVCFPPAFVLSLITPVAIRLLLPDVRRMGRVVGTVYAVGTLGSLAGNFVTGFYLSAQFGVSAIVLGAGLLTVVLALFVPPHEVAVGLREGDVAEDEPTPLEVNERLGMAEACGLVFVCSFASMALELAASRLLAPSVGVSLYSWTGIIGVVLAGVVSGNYLGGWIADRWPRRGMLASSLFWAGLFTLAILVLFGVIGYLETNGASQPSRGPGGAFWTKSFWSLVKDWGLYYAYLGHSWSAELSLPYRIVALAAILFFVPMLTYGAISPQVTRLAVSDRAHAGRVAGRVYAWSCAGAIAGTFATGWFLIGHFGVLYLILGLAVAITSLAIVVGRYWNRPGELIGCGVVIAAAIGAVSFGNDQYLRFSPNAAYEKETNYYLIKVKDVTTSHYEDDGSIVTVPEIDEQGFAYRDVVLDLLIHSHIRGKWVDENGKKVWQTDVSHLGYGHEQVQAEFARTLAAAEPSPHTLVIGGGGYTLPRWIDKFLPHATVDVVEIDPGVTEAVYASLGLPRDTRIRTHNLDGRQFIQELAEPQHYHLIIQDAVNDLSVPAHIMTKQYNDAVKRSLAADGVYLLTVIDEFPSGKLLPAAVATLQRTFPHVYIVGEQPLWDDFRREVFVIAGTQKPLDVAAMRATLEKLGVNEMKTTVMPAKLQELYLASHDSPPLTDDFAPVDNLIAQTYRKR